MEQPSIPALMAPPPRRDNPLTRSWAGMIGIGVLIVMLVACIGSLPFTLSEIETIGEGGQVVRSPRYDAQDRLARHLPPRWAVGGSPRFDESVDPRTLPDSDTKRMHEVAWRDALAAIAKSLPGDETWESLADESVRPTEAQLSAARPRYLVGTDLLGRSLAIRCLTGGGISLCIGLAAAALSVFLGTLYGSIAGFAGGRIDAVMMRIVDILYGLPYILLVVLLAVASGAVIDEFISRRQARLHFIQREARVEVERRGMSGLNAWSTLLETDQALSQSLSERAAAKFPERRVSEGTRTTYDLVTLLVAIGGVSWLTMARVVRGQVLSLKAQPFMEASRAMGSGVTRQFTRHLLPNLVGPIVVYATLTVPQAILQESFLSFLGIGVRPPLPSWGNLAAEGLTELNPFKSNWWLLLFPCLLLATTLLALNFVGEGLREAFDPKRSRR